MNDDEMLHECETTPDAVMWFLGIQAAVYLLLIAFFAFFGSGQ